MNFIIKLIETKQTQKDLWMVYELGGKTLSKSCYEMKG